MIYINNIPQTGNPVMEGIFISDARPEKRQPPGEPITIIAERGWLIADPASDRIVFRLENGGIHIVSRDFTTYQHSEFRTHDLQLSIGDEAGESLSLPKGLREMTLGELRAKIVEYRKLGVQQWAPLVEIHKKFSIPFAALILGFLGVAMGVLFRRGEKLVELRPEHRRRHRLLRLPARRRAARQTGAAQPLLGDVVRKLLLRRRHGAALPQGARRNTLHLAAPAEPARPPEGRGVTILQRYVSREFLKIFGIVLHRPARHHGARGLLPAHRHVRQLPDAGALEISLFRAEDAAVHLLHHPGFDARVPAGDPRDPEPPPGNHRRPLRGRDPDAPVSPRSWPSGRSPACWSSVTNEFVVPGSARQLQYVLDTHIKNRPARSIFRQNRIWFYGERNTIFNIQLLDPVEKLLEGVTLYRFDTSGTRLIQRIDARRARYLRGRWDLFNVTVRTFLADGTIKARSFPRQRMRRPERPGGHLAIPRAPRGDELPRAQRIRAQASSQRLQPDRLHGRPPGEIVAAAPELHRHPAGDPHRFSRAFGRKRRRQPRGEPRPSLLSTTSSSPSAFRSGTRENSRPISPPGCRTSSSSPLPATSGWIWRSSRHSSWFLTLDVVLCIVINTLGSVFCLVG